MNILLLESLLGGAGQLGFVQSALYPELQGVQQRALHNLPNTVPQVDYLIQAVISGGMTETEGSEWAQRLGFMPAMFRILLESSKKRLQPADYVTLLNRGEINEKIFYQKLQEAGYAAEDSKYIRSIAAYYPSVSDLILFSVKEVFSPATVALYGQDKDFPPEFLLHARKQGLSDEFAKMYWAAHWSLPSITQGFEMLQRGVISPEGLNDLLRAQDVMPYWRDKLTKISYNTLTRVDVRRMYALNVLDAAGVEKAYRDGGYSPEDAARLRDFVVKDVSDENNGLTKSLILQSYQKALISREEAIQYLKRLDYADDIISLILDVADYDDMIKDLNAAEASLTEAYLTGAMSLENIRDAIRSYGVHENYVTKFLGKLSLQGYKNRKRPTVADLKRWLTRKLITPEQFAARLVSYGYSKEDALLYATEAVTDNLIAGGN